MPTLPFYKPDTVEYPINTNPVLVRPGSIVKDTGTLPILVADPIKRHSIVTPPVVRVTFRREGYLLHGKGFLVHNGEVELLNATVDLRPIMAMARKRVLVSGIFGDIGKWVSKVGRSKVIKSISKGASDVLKSKVTGGIIAATAVVFPPVGLPAAAAYAAANVALSAIEGGASASSVARGAVAAVDQATGGKHSATLATIDKGLAITEQAQAQAGRTPSVPSSGNIKSALVKSQKAKAFLRRVSHASKTPGPGQAEAKKFVKVISLVHRNRQNLRAISNTKGVAKLRNVPKVIVHRGKNDGLMKIYRALLKTTRISGCRVGCESC